MKWVVLATFVVLVPLLAAMMRSRPDLAPKFWALLGFLPLIVAGTNLDVAPISWPMWSGYAKGLEISLVDVLALAILIARPSVKGFPPFLGLWFFFAFTTFLSVFQADMPQAALFAVWQVMRATVIFLAVASICNDERGPRILLMGASLGLLINAGFSIYQRMSGELQPDGLYSHQNLLGMVSHFVAFPALALLLGGTRSKVLMVGVAAAIVAAALTASRATIGLAGAGYVLLLLLSLARRPTSRKWGAVAIGAVGLAVAAPLALTSLDRRFDNTQPSFSGYDERAAFEKTARSMVDARPFGHGANQYVVAANTKGYSEAAGVGYAVGSRSAHVHHTYLLVAAEQGYLGVVALVALLIWPTLRATRSAFAMRKSAQGDLLLGPAVALVVVMLHILYEWVFVTYEVQSMFAMTLGIIAGVLRRGQTSRQKRVGRRSATVTASEPRALPA